MRNFGLCALFILFSINNCSFSVLTQMITHRDEHLQTHALKLDEK